MMKSLFTTAAALVALSIAAQAQVSTGFQAANDAGSGTVNALTGEISFDSVVDSKSYTPHSVFANTDSSGYYTQWGTTSEAVDYGTLYTVGGSNIVTLYQFAYATSTNNPGPVTLCNLIYEGYWGNCAALGLAASPSGGFCFSGLPGTIVAPYNGWTFTVWTTATAMWRQNNGDFMHGMIFFDSVTGPSLRYAGSAINGAIPDGNNQDMFFDGYAPDVTNSTACGGYWFGTYIYNFGSWHLVIEQVDKTASVNASCAFYCGSSINLAGYTVSGDFVLGGTFVGTVTVVAPNIGAVVAGYLGQLTFPIWGQEGLVHVGTPEVMGLPSAITGGPGAAVITWYVVANTAYAGFHVYTQAAGFGGFIQLYCAYDCTVGY
jgi:hypothetical protein